MDVLRKIAKKINPIKVTQHTKFSQNREMCKPQNRGGNVLQKFHVIRQKVFFVA